MKIVKLYENNKGTPIFDITTTGDSSRDRVIPGNKNNEYMEKWKGIIGTIEYMTPREYFFRCADALNCSVTDLINQRVEDIESLKFITDNISSGKKLDLPYIDYVTDNQEGLHRMMAVARMFGWDSDRYPVLIIRKKLI